MGFERPVSTGTTRLRFLFTGYPEIMGQVLRIVYRAIATHLCHQAGFRKADARCDF